MEKVNEQRGKVVIKYIKPQPLLAVSFYMEYQKVKPNYIILENY